MGEMQGAMGTVWSLVLRIGQALLALASLLLMCLRIDFYSYSAFCFLVAIMGLVIPWSLALALVDAISILLKNRVCRPPGILSVLIEGDWVISLLSLAASCSSASVIDFLVASEESFCIENICTKFQLAAVMAFLSWFLLLASSLFNLWYLASM